MTPKEKALELVHKYDLMQTYIEEFSIEESKQCALIAVDLAIEYNDFHIEFLQEVKQEIEKL